MHLTIPDALVFIRKHVRNLLFPNVSRVPICFCALVHDTLRMRHPCNLACTLSTCTPAVTLTLWHAWRGPRKPPASSHSGWLTTSCCPIHLCHSARWHRICGCSI